MVPDVLRPFVPYAVGAAVAVAIEVWTHQSARSMAAGVDQLPTYGLGRLVLFTLVVVAGCWLVFVQRGSFFGVCAVCCAPSILISADEGRGLRTDVHKPIKSGELSCLLPFALVAASPHLLVVFSEPGLSPATRSP